MQLTRSKHEQKWTNQIKESKFMLIMVDGVNMLIFYLKSYFPVLLLWYRKISTSPLSECKEAFFEQKLSFSLKDTLLRYGCVWDVEESQAHPIHQRKLFFSSFPPGSEDQNLWELMALIEISGILSPLPHVSLWTREPSLLWWTGHQRNPLHPLGLPSFSSQVEMNSQQILVAVQEEQASGLKHQVHLDSAGHMLGQSSPAWPG